MAEEIGETAIVERDPKGLAHLVRRKKTDKGACLHCGESWPLFEYGRMADGEKPRWDIRFFCSVECREEYFGEFTLFL